MKKTAIALLFGAALLASGCTHNMAVQQASDRIYLHTDLKSVTLTAVQAINASRLAVQTTNNPVTGMVVISARGTEYRALQIAAPTLTLTLTEIDPNRIRVDASAILPGQSSDFGLTESMITNVFKAMDAKLEAAGEVPRKL